MAVLRQVAPDAGPAGWGALDTAISRLKVDLGVSAADVAGDAEAGPVARTFVAYERALATSGSLDFDDLIVGALRALESDMALLTRWRGRCTHLLVDEVQDVDRMQLRLALLWRRRRTRSSWSVTTTSRSTAGGWPTCAGSSAWPRSCRDSSAIS
jgi:superfamily I DNA/RNA helicase